MDISIPWEELKGSSGGEKDSVFSDAINVFLLCSLKEVDFYDTSQRLIFLPKAKRTVPIISFINIYTYIYTDYM